MDTFVQAVQDFVFLNKSFSWFGYGDSGMLIENLYACAVNKQ